MRIKLAFALLCVSGTALAADDGYWHSGDGTVYRTVGGACWHTGSWSMEKAIPGCDGKPLVAPAPLPAPPPPPPPVVAAPPPDSDHDGVLDSADKCPGTPAGVSVDAMGCPPDADGDGVPDYLDKCPATPGGAVVDEAGCPKKLDHEVSIGLDVTFVTDKADISGDASAEIKKVANFMKQYPGVKVTIEGYTDNVGGTLKNKKLSQQRADAVKAAIVSSGVDGTRLNAMGFGMESPVADNKTVEGRAKNRRVVAHAKAETQVIEMKKP
jgi:OOP family OmpA-OmpF porin